MTQDDLRRGWCPGALRPMLSGDGYIVRIRPRGPAIPQALARAFADLADQFGNGLIDLTARANLQLRGVREEALPPLQAALTSLGLLDGSIAQEARRNILVSPLCGIDPTAALDGRPLYAALEAWLRDDEALAALPGKFSFGLDEGGFLPLAADASDLHARAQRSPDGVRLTVFAGGYSFLTCRPEDFLPVMQALTRTFLRLTPPGERMKALLASLGPVAFLQAAGRDTGEIGEAQEPPAPRPRLGLWPLMVGGFLLVGVPFGRLGADHLRVLAACAPEFRLTPWRSLLLPLAPEADPMAISARLAGAGFLTEPNAPLAAVAACAGSPACDRASRPVQDDARLLADALPEVDGDALLLHVSGCAKGCAHPRKAPLTLVARAGRYDVVLHGSAAALPHRSGLPVAEARAFLAQFFTIKGV